VRWFPLASDRVSRFRVTGLIVNIVPIEVAWDTNSCMSDATAETEDVSQDLNASGLGPAAVAAIGSVALALYYYYVRGDEQRGQFIGLWPATILGMASYLKFNELSRELRSDDD
jgi:hypothetical protein